MDSDRVNFILMRLMYVKRHNQPTPSDPVTLTITEHIDITFKEDGAVEKFELEGRLAFRILNRDDGFIKVQVETGENPGIVFKPHPYVDLDLLSAENILAFKDPKRPFPPCNVNPGLSLMTWRMQSANASLVPLSFKYLHSVSGNETHVSLRYDCPCSFELQNVMIYIPIRASAGVPRVLQIDGDWRYDSEKLILEWSIVRIDKSNCSGSLEFVVPTLQPFPVTMRLTSTSPFADLKVINVLPVGGGNPPKFTYKYLPSSDNFDFVSSSLRS